MHITQQSKPKLKVLSHWINCCTDTAPYRTLPICHALSLSSPTAGAVHYLPLLVAEKGRYTLTHSVADLQGEGYRGDRPPSGEIP